MNIAGKSKNEQETFQNECKAKCRGHSTLGKYLGCYKDTDDVGMGTYIGHGLSIK